MWNRLIRFREKIPFVYATTNFSLLFPRIWQLANYSSHLNLFMTIYSVRLYHSIIRNSWLYVTMNLLFSIWNLKYLLTKYFSPVSSVLYFFPKRFIDPYRWSKFITIIIKLIWKQLISFFLHMKSSGVTYFWIILSCAKIFFSLILWIQIFLGSRVVTIYASFMRVNWIQHSFSISWNWKH